MITRLRRRNEQTPQVRRQDMPRVNWDAIDEFAESHQIEPNSPESPASADPTTKKKQA